MNSHDLIQGTVFSNTDLHSIFKVGNSGGMRKSNTANSLVLITNRVESLYEDQWQDSILHYTGMGQEGDQKLHWSSNKTLAESNTNGIALHLFEVFKEKEYTYQGLVTLAAKPYPAQQFDKHNTMRTVWVFPLRLLTGQPLHLEEEKTHALFLTRVSRKNRQLTDTQLKQIERKPRAVQVPTHTAERVIYSRDPDIVLYALRRANGFCELCEQHAPFDNREGLPFLEVHHIVYLSRGGHDTIDNVAALCPNCHRRMHILERQADIKKLTKKSLQLISISAAINSN